MIKGICFDLDGVYFKSTGIKGFIQELTQLCGDEQKALHAMLWDEEINQFKQGALSEQEFWSYVNTYLGLSLTVPEYASLLGKHYEIDSNIQTIVQKVRKLGYKTLICSNNYPTRIQVLQEKFGFFSDFDVRIFSYEVGITKPDIRIFKKLIETSRLEANEIVYADDQENKLTGACALGINTTLYTTFEAYQQYLISLGVLL